jgi:hypothetical protein
VAPDLDTRTCRRPTACLLVEDADALARSWLAAGGDVRPSRDTEWDQHEGLLVHPDRKRDPVRIAREHGPGSRRKTEVTSVSFRRLRGEAAERLERGASTT